MIVAVFTPLKFIFGNLSSRKHNIAYNWKKCIHCDNKISEIYVVLMQKIKGLDFKETAELRWLANKTRKLGNEKP